MKNSKLITILRSFQTKELTRFKEYVDSPYFNKHKTIRQLCHHILQFAPDFDSDKLKKERIYKVLRPKSLYNETFIYTHTSNLLQLLCDFMAQEAFESNAVQKKLYTLQELRIRNQHKQFNSVVKQYQLLQQKAVKDRDYHYYQGKLFNEQDQINPVRNQDMNIQQMDSALEIVFLIDKMRIACDMNNRNSIIGSNYEASGIDLVLQWIERNKEYYLKFPEVRINYTIYKLVNTGDKSYYDDLRLYLADKTQLYPRLKMKEIYDYLINHCIQKLNTGDTAYYREFFELHRFLLQEEILLLEDNSLAEWDYKNIVTVGARLEEFEWVKSFIFEYKEKVQEKVRENVFSYNLAYYYFSRKNYKEALQLLHQVDFTDASYYIGAKIIQLKSYHVLEEFEASLSLIATFKNYIQRSKVLSESKKLMNQNMLKLAQKIIHLETQKITYRKQKLQQKKAEIAHLIDSLQPLANADWLRAILAEV